MKLLSDEIQKDSNIKVIIFKASDAIVNKDPDIDNSDDKDTLETEDLFITSDEIQNTATNIDDEEKSDIGNIIQDVKPMTNQQVKECGLRKWFWACKHFPSWNEDIFK